MLFVYGDSLMQEGDAPLATLGTFAEEQLRNSISLIHLLPFYPWGSEDGGMVMCNPGHPGYIAYTRKWIHFYIVECGYPSAFWPYRLLLGRTVSTRALRLRLTSISPVRHPM